MAGNSNTSWERTKLSAEGFMSFSMNIRDDHTAAHVCVHAVQEMCFPNDVISLTHCSLCPFNPVFSCCISVWTKPKVRLHLDNAPREDAMWSHLNIMFLLSKCEHVDYRLYLFHSTNDWKEDSTKQLSSIEWSNFSSFVFTSEVYHKFGSTSMTGEISSSVNLTGQIVFWHC